MGYALEKEPFVSVGPPSADPMANFQQIQGALNEGGEVVISVPGVYIVSDTLVMGNNTTLRGGDGVTLRLRSGLTNTPILRNADMANGNSNITVENITLDHDGGGQIRSDGATFTAFCVIFQRVSNLKLQNVEIVNPLAWGLTIAACTKFFIDHINFNYGSVRRLNQDGCHVCGGSYDGTIQNIYGSTGDDMVALITEDYGVYEFSAPKGTIENVTISNVISDVTLGTYRHVRLLSTTNFPMKNVSVSGVKGKYQLSSILVSSITGQNGDFQNINIENVEVQQQNTTSTEPSILVSTIADDLTLRDIKRWCPAGETPQPLFRTSAVIRHLMVDGVHVRDQTTAGASWFTFNSASGSLQYGQFSNIKIWSNQGTATGAVLEVVSPYSLNRVQFNGVMCEKIRYLALLSGNTTRSIQIANVSMDNNNNPAIFQNGAFTLPLLQISNMYLQGTQGGANGCIRFNGLSGSCLVDITNSLFENGANPFVTRVGAETFRVRTLHVPVDTAVLTPTRGDVILNRTSNNDPFRWDGAAWTAM